MYVDIKSWVRGTTILTPPPPPPFKYEILKILISLFSIFIENWKEKWDTFVSFLFLIAIFLNSKVSFFFFGF